MTGLRRAIAVVLVLLLMPSVAWLVVNVIFDKQWQPWPKELVFVAACLLAAGAAWRAMHLWRAILLAVTVLYTYVITWPLVTTVLISSPIKYIGAVTREATRREFSEGAWLVWSLLVLPAAFPILCLLAVSLTLTTFRPQPARAI